MDGGGLNRRRARRYPLDAPVQVGLREGRARDMSSGGLYFRLPAEPSPEATLDLRLDLPGGGSGPPIRVELRAKVVRIEELGSELGIAARIETWALAP